MTSRKILIVDDDADLSEALMEQLSLYEEFELSHAATATAGLQDARESHVDLVIMDVGLPDMDGREAVKLLLRVIGAEQLANECDQTFHLDLVLRLPTVSAGSLFSTWASWSG